MRGRETARYSFGFRGAHVFCFSDRGGTLREKMDETSFNVCSNTAMGYDDSTSLNTSHFTSIMSHVR